MSRGAPLVSVYLPTRNRSALLRQAIESVLGQQHREIELIVVDDASTDDTPSLLRELATLDQRVRCLRLEEAKGAPAARNLAIREARGEFVTGIDDDDLMLPGRVASLLAAWQEGLAFVCSATYVVGGDWYDVHDGTRAILTPTDILMRNQVSNQVLTRTVQMREVGMFDEEQPSWQDYDLWTRLLIRYGKALRLAEPTYVRRADPGLQRITNSQRALEGALRYFRKFETHMGPEQRKSQMLLQAAVARRRLTLGDAARLWSPGTAPFVLRYWVRSNLPVSERLLDRWRAARRPLASLPIPL
jgi:glycosyltransferase involved in cell wall biosynthesis